MVSTVLKRIDRRVLALVAAVLLVAVAVNLVRSPAEMKTVTAHFPRAVSVYKGTDVRILGVNVGKVTAVIPEGNSVRVEMEYDASYEVPAKAQAVIVTPTLVADRFVQLTPVFQGGDVMADGADIPLPETAVPVELDRIYGSLQALTRALGPNGVNADGTLDHLLAAGTKAFSGQGARGNQMIQDLADAAQTFGDGAGPLFESVTQLAKFTTTLAENDTLVRAFMQDLTGVSAMLADESDELQQAVAAVAKAVGSVKGFVKNNRDAFVADIEKLTEVMRTIASEKDNIQTAVEVAPVAMGNLAMGFDHVSDSQNSRFAIGGNVWDADGFICGLIQQHPAMPPALKDTACELIEKLIEPIVTQLPWLPPEYKTYLPKQAASKKGVKVPDFSDVSYSTGDDASVQNLLGGGS
ncbi:MCE family protein [Nocardioides nitrophenolicus]|uniref:MCE family protein n=1 Tax=Nocardioides nitrophenolicus TaxID=60489 RepID=UPI00195DF0AB|nr:MCE family protein [Nocardioides nitrophenolicus]MBM7515161.1 virulence factor Mce-like protein [Nocardioides nitrophenolicus]